METKKPAPTEATKLVDLKRQKQQQNAQKKLPPGARELSKEERSFVEHWCVHMRGIDRAMYMFQLAKLVNKLAKAEQNRQSGGLVKPDGSNLT